MQRMIVLSLLTMSVNSSLPLVHMEEWSACRDKTYENQIWVHEWKDKPVRISCSGHEIFVYLKHATEERCFMHLELKPVEEQLWLHSYNHETEHTGLDMAEKTKTLVSDWRKVVYLIAVATMAKSVHLVDDSRRCVYNPEYELNTQRTRYLNWVFGNVQPSFWTYYGGFTHTLSPLTLKQRLRLIHKVDADLRIRNFQGCAHFKRQYESAERAYLDMQKEDIPFDEPACWKHLDKLKDLYKALERLQRIVISVGSKAEVDSNRMRNESSAEMHVPTEKFGQIVNGLQPRIVISEDGLEEVHHGNLFFWVEPPDTLQTKKEIWASQLSRLFNAEIVSKTMQVCWDSFPNGLTLVRICPPSVANDSNYFGSLVSARLYVNKPYNITITPSKKCDDEQLVRQATAHMNVIAYLLGVKL